MTNRRREINKVRPDLKQLKAMAHPVRLTMLSRLRLDGPATATSLAAQLGLNSGATSYHLRQLAEAGLVVEDTSRGNKRDRWWKAAHESTETAPSDVENPEEHAVMMGAYHNVVAQQAAQQIVQAAAETPELPTEWADLAGASDWNLYLTKDQVRRAKDAVHAILSELVESTPKAQAAPADAVPFVFQFHSFPRPGTLTHRDEDDEQ